jgi:transposase
MNRLQVEARRASGQAIARRFEAKIRRVGNIWFVPSARSARKQYEVDLDPTNLSCTCPDHAENGEKCKHVYAVEYLIGGTPEPNSLFKIERAKKPTYRRSWDQYNAAQISEEKEFSPILSILCETVPRHVQQSGRPRAPIGDVVFGAVTKVFLTKSARRVMSRLKSAHEDGYLERPMTFNTLLGYMAKPELTQVLQELLIKSSLPFRSLETSFAIDSTGVAGNRFVRWTDVKYRGVTEHLWAKVHLMCGVKTHIITAAAILDRDASDVAQLPELLDQTAENFTVRQVCADAAYNSVKNQEKIAAIGAQAFIPFKTTHTGKRGGLWSEKYREWQEDRETFLKHYHQRSNVETAIMMWKTSFGDSLRSKTEIAMKNELYCKLICHNISCLIKGMYELKIGPEFLAESLVGDAAD